MASSLGCSENSLASWAANTGSSGTSRISFSTDRGGVAEASANSVTGPEPSGPVSCGATGTTSDACSSTGPTDSKNGSATGADSLRCGLTAACTGPTDSNGSSTGADSSRCGSTAASTGPTDSKNGSATGTDSLRSCSKGSAG